MKGFFSIPLSPSQVVIPPLREGKVGGGDTPSEEKLKEGREKATTANVVDEDM